MNILATLPLKNVPTSKPKRNIAKNGRAVLRKFIYKLCGRNFMCALENRQQTLQIMLAKSVVKWFLTSKKSA